MKWRNGWINDEIKWKCLVLEFRRNIWVSDWVWGITMCPLRLLDHDWKSSICCWVGETTPEGPPGPKGCVPETEHGEDTLKGSSTKAKHLPPYLFPSHPSCSSSTLGIGSITSQTKLIFLPLSSHIPPESRKSIYSIQRTTLLQAKLLTAQLAAAPVWPELVKAFHLCCVFHLQSTEYLEHSNQNKAP